MEINQIQNAGILCLNKAIELKTINLFYGYNGSGKTTLSRLFHLLNEDAKNIDIEDKVHNPKGGELVFKVNNQNFNRDFINRIRVFNKDFIEANISQQNSKMNKIVISQQAGEIHDRLQQLEVLEGKIKAVRDNFDTKQPFFSGVNGINNLQANFDKNQKLIDESIINYAKEVKTLMSVCGNRYLNYSKDKLGHKLQSIKTNIATLKQDLQYDNNLTEKTLNPTTNKNEMKVFGYVREEVRKLNQKTKIGDNEISTIDNLIRDMEGLSFTDIQASLNKVVVIADSEVKSLADEIKNWIQQGIKHHHGLQECYFCKGKLNNRLAELQTIFSKDFTEHKEQLENIKKQLTILKQRITSFRVNEQLSDNNSDVMQYSKEYNQHLEQIISQITDKLINYSNTPTITTPNSNLSSKLQGLQKLYNAHNESIGDSKIQEKAFERLETILVIAFLENTEATSYTPLYNKQEGLKKELEQANTNKTNAILEKCKPYNEAHKVEIKPEGIQIERQSLQQKLASVEIAINKIREYFTEIIDTDIQLELDPDDNTVFLIKRNNEVDKGTLSEGERTALAFAYFLTTIEPSVQNNQNAFVNQNLSETTIVIDDPISSLDYNVIYGIYNKIYHDIYSEGKKCKRLILLTHNWYFANLVINGFDFKKNSYSAFEIKRISKISSGIEFFTNFRYFENEYDFLLDSIIEFYKSHNGQKDCKIHLYNIGNICRRFLELYCQYNKESSDIKTLFKIHKNNGLLRWLHLSSHGGSIPDKEPIHTDANKIQEYLKDIIEILKKENNEKIKNKLK